MTNDKIDNSTNLTLFVKFVGWSRPFDINVDFLLCKNRNLRTKVTHLKVDHFWTMQKNIFGFGLIPII
jgi:hypothetical protein